MGSPTALNAETVNLGELTLGARAAFIESPLYGEFLILRAEHQFEALMDMHTVSREALSFTAT